MRKSKTETDKHWNERATELRDEHQKVNIDDDVQRSLETSFLLRHLKPDDRVLEVGCGNGFLTDILRGRCGHVEAFDFAEAMIEQARSLYGETNNRFSVGSVLDMDAYREHGPYDVVVCVRVLINLANAEEQLEGIRQMSAVLEPGGRLLLVEGFTDGFDALNELRRAAGMKGFSGASINFYQPAAAVEAEFAGDFDVEAEFHTGCFDFLTRIVYPALVGEDQAAGVSDFHRSIRNIPEVFNPDGFRDVARLRGYCLVKR